MIRSRFAALLLASMIALALLCGCGGGSVHARVNNGHGTLVIHLTDAPLDLSGVQSVNVTLSSVVVYPGQQIGSGVADPAQTELRPIVLMTHPQTFDLLTLTGGASALLASGEVPGGDYDRIRLEITDAVLVDTQGATTLLKIDSGKVDIPVPFHVSGGTETGVILDFDAGASVQVNATGSGQMILRPVVTPVSPIP
jgi:hypothetical protein